MRILYLEDEDDIADGVVELLTLDRYEVVRARDVDGAFEALGATTFDLAVLDVMIGDDDEAGFTVAQAMRDAGFDGSVMFLSARASLADRVHGLDIGGDDYLVKPFSGDEVRARVRALLRRGGRLKRAHLERGSLVVDLVARRVTSHGEPVDLSDREFAMIELLAHDPDRVLSVTDLLDRLFPNASSGPAVVRVYVSSLRKKLGDAAIETVAGGYRLGAR